MPAAYQIAFWNLENLFYIQDSPRRKEKLQRAIGGDLEGWPHRVLERKVGQLASEDYWTIAGKPLAYFHERIHVFHGLDTPVMLSIEPNSSDISSPGQTKRPAGAHPAGQYPERPGNDQPLCRSMLRVIDLFGVRVMPTLFAMPDILERILMKALDIVGETDIGLDKLPALGNAFILVFECGGGMFETFPDPGLDVCSDQFHKGIGGTAGQGLVGLGNRGFDGTGGFQPREWRPFTGTMDLDESFEKLMLNRLDIFLLCGKHMLEGGLDGLFIIRLDPFENRGDIPGIDGLSGILNDRAVNGIAMSRSAIRRGKKHNGKR